ncbi:UPF0158 family protein [Vallitaleaceae bacterium 9-2]
MITLEDVVEGIENQDEHCHYYYHVRSKSVVQITETEVHYAKSGKDLTHIPKAYQEGVLFARELIKNPVGAFIELPLKSDINGYRFMERFAMSLQQEDISHALWEILETHGALTGFTDKIKEYGIEQKWKTYKKTRYEELARGWCKTHHIEYTKTDKKGDA